MSAFTSVMMGAGCPDVFCMEDPAEKESESQSLVLQNNFEYFRSLFERRVFPIDPIPVEGPSFSLKGALEFFHHHDYENAFNLFTDLKQKSHAELEENFFKDVKNESEERKEKLSASLRLKKQASSYLALMHLIGVGTPVPSIKEAISLIDGILPSTATTVPDTSLALSLKFHISSLFQDTHNKYKSNLCWMYFLGVGYPASITRKEALQRVGQLYEELAETNPEKYLQNTAEFFYDQAENTGKLEFLEKASSYLLKLPQTPDTLMMRVRLCDLLRENGLISGEEAMVKNWKETAELLFRASMSGSYVKKEDRKANKDARRDLGAFYKKDKKEPTGHRILPHDEAQLTQYHKRKNKDYKWERYLESEGLTFNKRTSTEPPLKRPRLGEGS